MPTQTNAQKKEKRHYPKEDMPLHIRTRMLRNRMTIEWQRVIDMLEKGRRDAKGRTITEVWADMVLADPAGEFARVCQEILPKELVPEAGTSGATLSIQQLYLTAIQSAQTVPNPRQIEGKAEEEPEPW